MDSAPVKAQEDAIEEIQVTATRRPMQISDVSASVSVVSREEIALGSLSTDSLSLKPGVFLQQTTPGQGAAIVRGLKGSEVLHLVDGMRLNNAIFRNAPTQYLALVAPGTLERIEVVRGAPGSLYGSDAVGGVVQAISRMPEFAEPGSRHEAYVSYGTADLAKVVRASSEFGDQRFAVLLGGEYSSSGNRRTGRGSRVGPSGYSSEGARLAVLATPNEDHQWLFDVQFARQPETPRSDELIPGFGQTEPSSAEFFFAPNERLFAHVRHKRNNGVWGANWTFDLGFQRIVDDRISRGFQSDRRRFEANRSDLFGLTVNVTDEYDSGSWVAGAEIYHDRVSSSRFEEDLVSGLFAPIAARFPDGSTMDQAAIYGNLLRRIGERNSISGGIRFSAIETQLATTVAAPSASAKQTDISADLGWKLDLTDRLHVTANLGYGFRAPNVFDLGTLGERPGNRFNIPNSDLESERITQFDVGFRHGDELLSFDVVLFVLHYNDRISSVLTGDLTPEGRTVTQSRNIAEADIYGAEVSANWAISPALNADLVLNYLRGEQAQSGGGDEPADRIPPLNGRISLHYDWNDSLRIEPYIFFASEQSRLSPRDVNDVRIDPTGTDGWVTANVAAIWQLTDSLLLTTRIENIFDKRYRTHGSGIDAVGRNLVLSLQANW